MEFAWDPQKAAKNLRKHKVSFAERGDCFRIISARELTRAERRAYERRDIRVKWTMNCAPNIICTNCSKVVFGVSMWLVIVQVPT